MVLICWRPHPVLLNLLALLLWAVQVSHTYPAAAAEPIPNISAEDGRSSRVSSFSFPCGGSGAAAVIASTQAESPQGGPSTGAAGASLTTGRPGLVLLPNSSTAPCRRAKSHLHDPAYLGQLYAARRHFPAQAGMTVGNSSSSSSIPRGDASISSKDGVTTASVCPEDPEFQQLGYNRNTGRLFINYKFAEATYMCTAWFVSPRHVVTAAHCVSSNGQYHVRESDPGQLCLNFVKLRNGRTACRANMAYRLVKWVTTQGYIGTPESSANDGAVIEVAPLFPRSSRTSPPQVQRIKSFYPAAVPSMVVFLDGYPGPVSDQWADVGCYGLNTTNRYSTQARVVPLNSGQGAGGQPVEYPLAGCMGESGGRVLAVGPSGTAWGIQTYGNTTCEGDRGMTGVTQITEAATECGVCVSCLIKAIEDS